MSVEYEPLGINRRANPNVSSEILGGFETGRSIFKHNDNNVFVCGGWGALIKIFGVHIYNMHLHQEERGKELGLQLQP